MVESKLTVSTDDNPSDDSTIDDVQTAFVFSSSAAAPVMVRWLKRHGYVVTRPKKEPRGPVAFQVDLLICPHQFIPWQKVISRQAIASHFLNRTKLVNKDKLVSLCENLRVRGMPLLPLTALIQKSGNGRLEDRVSKSLVVLGQSNRNAPLILKPGNSSNGNDISVVHHQRDILNKIALSERQSWLLQEIVHPPMTVDGKRFSIRVLCLVAGRAKLYIHSAPVIVKAQETSEGSFSDGELMTNTLLANLNSSSPQEKTLGESLMSWPAFCAENSCPDLKPWMEEIVVSLFENSIDKGALFTLPNCFEMFGLDFLVDTHMRPYLLEVNTDPNMALFEHCYSTEEFSSCVDEILDIGVSGVIDSPDTRLVSWKLKADWTGSHLFKDAAPDVTEASLNTSQIISGGLAAANQLLSTSASFSAVNDVFRAGSLQILRSTVPLPAPDRFAIMPVQPTWAIQGLSSASLKQPGTSSGKDSAETCSQHTVDDGIESYSQRHLQNMKVKYI